MSVMSGIEVGSFAEGYAAPSGLIASTMLRSRGYASLAPGYYRKLLWSFRRIGRIVSYKQVVPNGVYIVLRAHPSEELVE